MSHAVLIASGEEIEVYQYDGDLPIYGRGSKRGKRDTKSFVGMSDISKGGKNADEQVKSKKVRSERNSRIAARNFRRLVSSNLGRAENPILATFTYRENMGDLRQGRADWNAFARRAFGVFGEGFKYITVAEFQLRGAVHFHALLWGIAPSIVAGERSTRLVASLWGKGFVDLAVTNGSDKLATYLAKYLSKTYTDPRLFGMKAYIASRNVKRPYIDRGAILSSYWYTERDGIDLSTAICVHQHEYDTQFYGRAIYKRFKQLKT